MASTSSKFKPNKPCEELIARGIDLLKSGQWADCNFLVGPEPVPELIPGFKLILALTSPVFEAMFYGSLAEKNDPITTPDVNPTDFKVFLNYIYTNKLNLRSVDQAFGLYYCGKKFLLPNLQTLCSEYLLLELDPSNACSIFEYGQLFEDNNLTDKATEIMTDATMLVIKDSSFDKVKISTMLHLFSLRKLNIESEMNLLEVAVRYSKVQDTEANQNEITDRELSIQNAIENIRFLTVTPQQFAENQVKSVVLTESEVLAILLNLTSDKTNVSYPSRLSNSREQRLCKVIDKTIRLSVTVLDFKNVKVISPRFDALNSTSWRIMIRLEPYSHSTESENKCLAGGLICNSNKNSLKWAYNATYHLELRTNDSDSSNIRKGARKMFSEDNNEHGFSNFISLKDVLDPRKGFLKNGVDITVNAIVKDIEPYIL